MAPDGHEVTEQEWVSGHVRCLGVFLNGDAIGEPGPRGEQVTDDSFLLLLNGAAERVGFVLPDDRWAPAYDLELDTADDGRADTSFKAQSIVDLESRSVVLLRASG